MQLRYHRHDLIFKRPAGTSRGVLLDKPTWFLRLEDEEGVGEGEISLIPGLSLDQEEQIDGQLQRLQTILADYSRRHLPLEKATTLFGFQKRLQKIALFLDDCELSPLQFPGLRFAMEMGLCNLAEKRERIWCNSSFAREEQALAINGLIWMGEPHFMNQQIEAKLAEGYRCLKLKIGAIDFAAECAILAAIRKRFSPAELEIRVDANGAFSPVEAQGKLETLAQYSLHSIEQPIAQGQWQEMALLCKNSPLAIALDEELIGVPISQQQELLQTIMPQYIIVKPSLLGGFFVADSWISWAEKENIGWWNTSALESNLGLDAIAQWTALYQPTMPQGLGTGALYTNNIDATLRVAGGYLHRGNTT